MSKREEVTDYAEELRERFERWDNLKEHGGNDPFWADGISLNLVRNHIIYFKRKLEETLPVEEYPDIFYRETPPKMDYDYMARADEIRTNAEKVLMMFEHDENLKLIKRKMMFLDEKFSKKICAANVAGYALGLKIAIESDDLVTMRRYESYETYLESFQSCADKIRAYRPPENEQIDLFSALDAADDEAEELEMSM